MRSWVDGNLARAWRTILAEVRDESADIGDEIDAWESDDPSQSTLVDFYRYYVWVVYNAGMKVEVLDKLWERMGEALHDFDVEAVAGNRATVQQRLRAINKHAKKAEAVLITAVQLAQRPQIWERLQRVKSPAQALDELMEFPGIGRDSRYHLARNLGWDVPTHAGFTRALADDLRTDCDTLVRYLKEVSGLRISTTDMLLGHWRRLPQHESDEECVARFRVLIGLD